MKASDFYSKLNPAKYQVFLFSCPCSWPVGFASHNWFVINKKGKVSRWEVAHKVWDIPTRWGYLYKDLNTLDNGLEVIYGIDKWHWKSKLLGFTEGDENSEAKRMADFIENSKENYPFKDTYHFWGPNSNTYTQWVLDNFPDFKSKAKLPLNAIGKNFKK